MLHVSLVLDHPHTLKYIVVHLGFKLHASMHEDDQGRKKHVPGNV